MAVHEDDREDLMREATGYSQRGLWMLPESWAERELFLGLRAAGGLSVYCGQLKVYQFTPCGKLRRAFWNDTKLAASQGILQTISRDHRGGRVQQRWDAAPTSLVNELQSKWEALSALRDEWKSLTCVATIPSSEATRDALMQAWLDLPAKLVMAEAPNATTDTE
ncbi:MAG: hypothetical protein U0905_22130 [Pirellulales bacterium]